MNDAVGFEGVRDEAEDGGGVAGGVDAVACAVLDADGECVWIAEQIGVGVFIRYVVALRVDHDAERVAGDVADERLRSGGGRTAEDVGCGDGEAIAEELDRDVAEHALAVLLAVLRESHFLLTLIHSAVRRGDVRSA